MQASTNNNMNHMLKQSHWRKRYCELDQKVKRQQSTYTTSLAGCLAQLASLINYKCNTIARNFK